MTKLAYFGRKAQHLCSPSMAHLVFRVSPFWIQLFYFIILSIIGYGALKLTNPRVDESSRPKDIDVFFTSVSAATVSSMSTVEMEVFSNAQLVIMTILMFVGGEVFTSMVELFLSRSQFLKHHRREIEASMDNQVELGIFTHPHDLENKQPITDQELAPKSSTALKYNSIKCLGYVVLGYLVVVHGLGASLVSMYVSLVPSAREVLKHKGIEIQTFSVFTIVSTFASCGFVPTNENMMVFNKNSGLLLLLIPQILLGNTLYPTCLRLVIWFLDKFTKRQEFQFMLKNHAELGYAYLFSGHHSLFLAITAIGFIIVQFILFCAMEWNSDGLGGLNGYQKFVGSLFEVVNSRHTGESIVDLSTISSAILVLFVVMMYLPPHTTFLPAKYREDAPAKSENKRKQQQRTLVESVLSSQLSYLAIFIILICITEREKLKEDPLNFNALNITIEVVSAYGNVGFSTCHSCKREIHPQKSCEDKWYGFVGSWSIKGKIILIVVMFFGRLKKFNMKGGKAWKLQ